MAHQELSKNTALNPGCDSWFIPHFHQSNWAKQIDWYLNFQLTKLATKKSFKVNPHIEEIAKEEEFEIPILNLKENAPILTACSKHLPTSHLIQVHFEDLESWVKDIYDIAKQMRLFKLRIFLPKSYSHLDLVKYLNGDPMIEISIVEELDH